MLCAFFFFKQKTAYEMRISDLSSDVCSSDLPTLLQQLVEIVAGDMHFVDQQSDQPEVDLLFVDAADRHEAGLESEVIPVVREQLKNVAFHLRWCIDATACTPQIDNLHTSPFGPRALPAGAPPIMRWMVT